MIPRKTSKTALIAVLATLAVGHSFATQVGTTWTEDGDANQTQATAQATIGTGALSQINGIISPSDQDWFKILILDGSFSADTLGTGLDTTLYLWDSTGTLVANNDDFGPGFESSFTGTFAPGSYTLGISHLAPMGQLDNREYSINLSGASFSGASVPDGGATASLLGLALFSVAAIRRRLA